MIQPTTSPLATTSSASGQSEREAALRAKAVELEASFLSVMLGQAGLGGLSGEFSGGIGEEQFSSFLRDAQARAMAERGGIGLSETIFRAMMKGTADG